MTHHARLPIRLQPAAKKGPINAWLCSCLLIVLLSIPNIYIHVHHFIYIAMPSFTSNYLGNFDSGMQTDCHVILQLMITVLHSKIECKEIPLLHVPCFPKGGRQACQREEVMSCVQS